MNITKTPLQGLIVIEPRLFSDHRGYFFESFQKERHEALGLPPFVQDNLSRSKKNVLRGLHYQLPHEQGKLVQVTRGSVWDVAVDIRRESNTFGKWFGIVLDDQTHKQMYIPPGFAHGFCVLSDEADFMYKCTDFYAPDWEHGILWSDPALKIEWPIDTPIIAPKDESYPTLAEIKHEHLF